MKSKRNGIINELFSGVSSNRNGVFKYKNGICFFFRNNKTILYEYDECLNVLIKANPIDFSTFNI